MLRLITLANLSRQFPTAMSIHTYKAEPPPLIDFKSSSAVPPLVIRMPLPRSAQVLVVGAGPAGITLALALQQQGCPNVAIVDSVTSGQNTSRAVAVHAATIEVCYTTD